MKYISADYIKAIMKSDRLMQGNCEYELWKQEVDKKVDAMPSIDISRMKRNEAEIKAYVDGYNDCFRQFKKCLKGRKSVIDSIRKMELFVTAVNRCVESEPQTESEDE